jgi:hypothetical protein
MTASIIDPAIVQIATADIEQDLINNSGETRELSLLIHVANNGTSSANVQLWITNSSNTKLFPVLPETSVGAKAGLSNSTKLVLKAGNKIRITASSTDVYAMICPVSGL